MWEQTCIHSPSFSCLRMNRRTMLFFSEPSSARHSGTLPFGRAHMLCFKSHGLRRGHRPQGDSVSVPRVSPTSCRAGPAACGLRPRVSATTAREGRLAKRCGVARATRDHMADGLPVRQQTPPLRLRSLNGLQVPTTAFQPAKQKAALPAIRVEIRA